MDNGEKLLKEFSETEKTAYLGAIASIATADRAATDEEVEYLETLIETAGISLHRSAEVIKASKETSEEKLKEWLEILKTSELRFSLITDIISFARADNNYSDVEKNTVEKIAHYLNIDQNQFLLLDQFVHKSADSGIKGADLVDPKFIENPGLRAKFNSAGINIGIVAKGLLGIFAPAIISNSIMGGAPGRRIRLNSMDNRAFAGQDSGGIGSLISILSGARGYNHTGGLLARLF